jgi:hypothetical protein
MARPGVHNLSELDPETRSAKCSHCGPVTIHVGGRDPYGAPKWRCQFAKKELYAKRHRAKIKKMKCERCGFVATILAQLDEHHYFGRGVSDQVELLCANCHRLVSWYERKIGRHITWRELPDDLK